jgi:hypothetical protein
MSKPIATMIPSQCQGMDVRIPVHKGRPNEPLVVLVNSGSAILLTCDRDGHISDEMIPLIDAVARVEAFIAMLKADGHVEQSEKTQEAVRNAKVVALIQDRPDT